MTLLTTVGINSIFAVYITVNIIVDIMYIINVIIMYVMLSPYVMLSYMLCYPHMFQNVLPFISDNKNNIWPSS